MDKKLELHAHKINRDCFISDIVGFNEACIAVKEKGLSRLKKVDGIHVNVENLKQLTDERLVQIHKWFWDEL